MSPRLDLFGQPDDLDEWPEEPDDSPLLEDDLGAMVGRYEGQSITDLIRDETGGRAATGHGATVATVLPSVSLLWPQRLCGGQRGPGGVPLPCLRN